MSNKKSKSDHTFIRRHSRKLHLIKIKGGCCEVCGYDLQKNPHPADFHHVDPKEKERGISTLLTCRWELALQESKKCILICKNCHATIHSNSDKYKTFEDEIMKGSEDDFITRNPVDESLVHKLLLKKKTCTEIANTLNCPIISVYQVATRLEKKTKKKLFKRVKEYNLEKQKVSDEELLQFRKEGYTQYEIAKKFSMNQSAVSRRLKRLHNHS
jgi:hypothetical protein